MIPESFGRFVVEAEVAKHEFGATYKGVDPKFKRPVALRTFRLDSPGAEAVEALHRLQQEARAASTLSSPNIVSIYGGGEDHGHFFVVMEFVEGFTIQSLLDRKNKDISISELTDITRQVCLALDHAQSKGFVHPNLRPVNLMSEWDGMLKIMDYGIPKPGLVELLTKQSLPNRLHYSSPEELRGERPDLRSNVFSLGTILYEMLTGTKAFDGATADEVKQKLEQCAPTPPATLIKNSRFGICSVIEKALAKLPNDRYASGADLIRDLESKNSSPVVSPKASAPAPVLKSQEIGIASPRVAAHELATASSNEADQAKKAASVPQASSVPTVGTVYNGDVMIVDPSSAELVQVQAAKAPKSQLMDHPIAKQAEILIQKIPLKYGLYSIAGVVALMLIGTIAMLGYHKGKAYEPPTPVVVAEVAPMPLAPAPEIVRNDVAAKEAEVTTTEVIRTVQPNSRKKPKMVAVAAPAAPLAPTTGGLTFNSVPEGANIQIDGRSEPSWVTPFTANGLPAGSHTVSFSKAGYTAHMQSVIVPAGSTAAISATLNTTLASLAVVSEPAGASVLLDGQETGKVTPATLSVDKGRHTVVVRRAGYFDAETTTELAAGQSFQFSPALKVMGDVDSIKTAGKLKRVFGGGPKDMGSVLVKSLPKGARIELNHRMLDKTAPAEFLLAPGNYLVTVSMPGYKTLEKMVTVEMGGRVVVDENLGN